MALNEAQKIERANYLEEHLKITDCSQLEHYAFVSYASNDWETVFKSAVVPLQEQYGLRVFADKAFDKVNDKWIVPMLRNIRGADMVIAFVSQSYIESYACFLEFLTAVNTRKQIVFVSLGQPLHLGDTTDLPNIEHGAKKEIIIQGDNIATNTNNTSSDLMRAAKSAYTSITTLLEQDKLSKYDISDAFISFFRDASVNLKTVNDRNALAGTISSISGAVFGRPLAKKQPPNAAAQQPPRQQAATMVYQQPSRQQNAAAYQQQSKQQAAAAAQQQARQQAAAAQQQQARQQAAAAAQQQQARQQAAAAAQQQQARQQAAAAAYQQQSRQQNAAAYQQQQARQQAAAAAQQQSRQQSAAAAQQQARQQNAATAQQQPSRQQNAAAYQQQARQQNAAAAQQQQARQQAAAAAQQQQARQQAANQPSSFTAAEGSNKAGKQAKSPAPFGIILGIVGLCLLAAIPQLSLLFGIIGISLGIIGLKAPKKLAPIISIVLNAFILLIIILAFIAVLM